MTEDIPIVYIAAPFSARTKRLRHTNTLRALALGRLAAKTGLAPVVVHPSISRVFGDDDDPKAREIGVRANCAVVDGIAALDGSEIWFLALAKDDRFVEVSDGCKAEAGVWQARRGNGGMTVETWAGYADLAARYGLADLWLELAP